MKRRWSHEAQGMVLRLGTHPDQLIVTPYQQERGAWYCVVNWAPEGSSYPRGGYNIIVGDKEIEEAEEVVLS